MAGILQRLKFRSTAAEVLEYRPSDHDLIARVRNGEGAAFEKLMRRYNQRIFRTARAVLRDEAEAEDVVQETFVRAFRHLEQFEERSSVGTWLTRIAVNEALSRLRRSQRFNVLDSETNQEEGGSYSVESKQPGPEGRASSQELRSVLTAAIDSLSQELRTVFVLREIEGLSTLETSEALIRPLKRSGSGFIGRAKRCAGRLRNKWGNKVQGLFTFTGARCDRTVAQVFLKLGLTRLK